MSEENYEARLAAARDLYEGTNGLTVDGLAEITGIHKRTLVIAKRDGGWKKHLSTKTGQSTPEALAAAAMFESGEITAPERPAPSAATVEASKPVISPEEEKASAEAFMSPLPDERDELITRHKRELLFNRQLILEATKIRDTNPMRAFEKAKMAKLTGEAMKIVHDQERKLFGLDDRDKTVVIERAD